jgi:hypothetical protein
MKFCEYALHAWVYIHKNYGTVLMNIGCPLNLNAFYGLRKIIK